MNAEQLIQRLIQKGWPTNADEAKECRDRVDEARAAQEHADWLKRVDAVAMELRLLVRRKGLDREKQKCAIRELLGRIN